MTKGLSIGMSDAFEKYVEKQIDSVEVKINRVKDVIDLLNRTVFEDVKLRLGFLEKEVKEIKDTYVEIKRIILRAIIACVIGGGGLATLQGMSMWNDSEMATKEDIILFHNNLKELSKFISEL